MYFAVAVVIFGILFLCAFICGGLYTRHLMLDALDEARRQRQAEEYYRLAGYQKVGDPKPYIPPTLRPKTPKARSIPHMSTLDRLLHEGKRGTILVRADEK